MTDIENKASERAVEPMAKPTAEPTAEPPGEMPDEPLTERLLAELLDAPSIDAFVSTHESVERSLSDYLNQLLASKGLSRPRVIRAAGLNPTFGYQIFTGQRNPLARQGAAARPGHGLHAHRDQPRAAGPRGTAPCTARAAGMLSSSSASRGAATFTAPTRSSTALGSGPSASSTQNQSRRPTGLAPGFALP